jgi:uncharacterized protein YndB with AHSA1/START domain
MPASAKTSRALVVTLPSDCEVLLTRVFNAPRELVFEALTKPEHLKRWFGRIGWSLTVCEVDLRVGGKWRYVLQGPKGRSMGMQGVYREIAPPDRLVSTDAFDDYPEESVNTVTLTEENGKTTLRCRVLAKSKEVRDGVIASGMEHGANETYNRLAEHLEAMSLASSSGPELVITRTFDAPRDLVFACWSDPEHLQHWQGAPRGFTVTFSDSDIRPGGFFRICMRSADGIDRWIEGSYLEVAKPERLVYTHQWLDADQKPGPKTLITISLSDRGRQTELTLRQTGFTSVQARDGHSFGWNSAMDVLGDYLLEAPRAISVTRLLDAPRELVFQAWTDSEKHEYKDIFKPERLVYDGGAPGHFKTIVTFANQGEKTRLNMHLLFPSAVERETAQANGAAIQSANEALDRVSARLGKMLELVTTRVFDAPRELVFRAWTDPAHLRRWWGPKGFTNPRCEVDARAGGTIRIDMRAPDGTIHPMTGEFIEIVEPERLVFKTEALDRNGEPMFRVLNTITFAEEGKKTRLTAHVKVISVVPDAAPYLSGMEMGWSMMLDRLEEFLGAGVEA